MGFPVPYLRRIDPSAALIPQSKQRVLAYVSAERTDIRKRFQEFNDFGVRPVQSQPVAQGSSGTAVK